MTDQELDAIYTQFCYKMSGLGESNASLFLARFALLAMMRIADVAKLQEMIDAAADVQASGTP